MSQFEELDIRTKKVSRESSSKPWKSRVNLPGGQSARSPGSPTPLSAGAGETRPVLFLLLQPQGGTLLF